MIQKGPAQRRARADGVKSRGRSSSSKAPAAPRTSQVFSAAPVRRSHSLPQHPLRTPTKKTTSSPSAFGRSEPNKGPQCIELWGPLGAKQKAAADATPLHMRPGTTRSRQAPSNRSSRSSKTDSVLGTPKQRRSGSVGSAHRDTSTAKAKAYVVSMERDMMDMLQQSEGIARYALEYGAANCLKAIVAGHRIGRMTLMQCDARVAALADRLTQAHGGYDHMDSD